MPFRTLGLDRDADELAVRRAYARLLKQNRPDDDPVAFQQLNEAYQACLAQIRHRQWEAVQSPEAEDADAPPSDAGMTLPPDIAAHVATIDALADRSDPPDREQASDDSAEADETFDLHHFLERLFERIDHASAADVLAWLQAEPALYSIRLKSAITVDVVSAVTDREPLLPIATLDVIADFFAIQSLGPRDWWLVEQVESCRTIARTRDQFRAGRLPRGIGSEPPRYFDRLIDGELMQPRLRLRALALMLLPAMPTRIHTRVVELDQLTDGASAPMLNPRLSALTARLADRQRINLARLALTWIRVVVYTALAFGLLYVFSRTISFELIELGLILGAVFTGWQVGVTIYSWLRTAVERRGHGHLVREGTAALLASAALLIDVLAPAVPRSIVYLMAVLAVTRAVTVARLQTGYVIALLLGATDLLLGTLDLLKSPFSSMLAGLATTTAVVLAIDRVQARRQGLTVESVVMGESWIARASTVAAIGALAAAAILVGWMLT